MSIELDRLFDAHRGRLLSLCRRMVRDPERAEELVQETLLVAYKKLPEFEGSARFGTWIYGIARHLSLNAIRKKKELLVEDGVVEAADIDPGVLAALQRHERIALLEAAATAVLDPTEQEAVHMRYVLNVPLDRIDTVLGLGGSGARGLLQRCKRKLGRELRRRLSELGEGSSLFRG